MKTTPAPSAGPAPVLSRGGRLLFGRVPAWVNLIGVVLLSLAAFVLLATVVSAV